VTYVTLCRRTAARASTEESLRQAHGAGATVLESAVIDEASAARALAASLNPVELAQDLDRLSPKLGVLALKIRFGELPGCLVELGVTDLAVFRLLARLQLGHPRILGVCLSRCTGAPQQRPADEPAHDRE